MSCIFDLFWWPVQCMTDSHWPSLIVSNVWGLIYRAVTTSEALWLLSKESKSWSLNLILLTSAVPPLYGSNGNNVCNENPMPNRCQHSPHKRNQEMFHRSCEQGRSLAWRIDCKGCSLQAPNYLCGSSIATWYFSKSRRNTLELYLQQACINMQIVLMAHW